MSCSCLDLLEHIASNDLYPLEGRNTGHSGGLLQSCLDGVDGGVAQRTHGTADESNEGRLVAGEVGTLVLRLPDLQPLLEVRIRREVHSLVGALSQRREGHATVQRTESLLPDNRIQSMCRVSVLRHIQRISHRVMLRLQPNLNNLHRRHNRHRLSHTSRQASHEGSAARDDASVGIGQELLVGFEGSEADGHLGDNTGEDGAETLVEAERSLFLDDFDTGADEAAFGGAGLASATGELHADFDCVLGGIVLVPVVCVAVVEEEA